MANPPGNENHTPETAPANSVNRRISSYAKLPSLAHIGAGGHDLLGDLGLAGPSRRSSPNSRKREALLRSQAHLGEIDLLRGWKRMPTKSASASDYCVIVSRVEERPRAGVWPIRLRDKLPSIPVPLRARRRDAVIDLQALLDHVYDAAGYEDYLYENNPDPALSAEHAAWARQFLPDMWKSQ